MRRVTINGVTYATPFWRLFREHTETEFNELRDSIREIGIQIPVVLFDSPTHGRAIIDGIGRARIAEELGREVPICRCGEMLDSAAEAMAWHLNKRRHLSPEELRELREKELQRIPELRRAGMSLRAIANAIGEDHETVRRTLKKSLVEDSTSRYENDDDEDDYDATTWRELMNDAAGRGEYEEAAEYQRKALEAQEKEAVLPDRITGRDGKSYLATRAPVIVARPSPNLERNAALEVLAKARKHAAAFSACLAELLAGPLKKHLKDVATAFRELERELEAVKAD